MIKRIVKISICILILICLSEDVLLAKKGLDTLDFQGGGLKFISQQAYVKDRTSLSLFPDYKKFSSNMSISFDCDIYDANRYGYIFRLTG
jgi:hypothetical protein